MKSYAVSIFAGVLVGLGYGLVRLAIIWSGYRDMGLDVPCVDFDVDYEVYESAYAWIFREPYSEIGYGEAAEYASAEDGEEDVSRVVMMVAPSNEQSVNVQVEFDPGTQRPTSAYVLAGVDGAGGLYPSRFQHVVNGLDGTGAPGYDVYFRVPFGEFKGCVYSDYNGDGLFDLVMKSREVGKSLAAMIVDGVQYPVGLDNSRRVELVDSNLALAAGIYVWTGTRWVRESDAEAAL